MDIDDKRRFPFGKYRGEIPEDVPSGYLIWFAENIDPDNSYVEKLIDDCEAEYNYREKWDQHWEEEWN